MTSFDYVQVVQTATFISAGSLLDHVYVKQTEHLSTENTVVSVYYSDHDAVKINIYHT